MIFSFGMLSPDSRFWRYDVLRPLVLRSGKNHLYSDFSRPFSYGDNIEVEVRVLKLGRTSITFAYRVFKEGENDPRIIGQNVTVCLDMDSFQKMEISAWLRRLLEEQLEEPADNN